MKYIPVLTEEWYKELLVDVEEAFQSLLTLPRLKPHALYLSVRRVGF